MHSRQLHPPAKITELTRSASICATFTDIPRGQIFFGGDGYREETAHCFPWFRLPGIVSLGIPFWSACLTAPLHVHRSTTWGASVKIRGMCLQLLRQRCTSIGIRQVWHLPGPALQKPPLQSPPLSFWVGSMERRTSRRFCCRNFLRVRRLSWKCRACSRASSRSSPMRPRQEHKPRREPLGPEPWVALTFPLTVVRSLWMRRARSSWYTLRRVLSPLKGPVFKLPGFLRGSD